MRIGICIWNLGGVRLSEIVFIFVCLVTDFERIGSDLFGCWVMYETERFDMV